MGNYLSKDMRLNDELLEVVICDDNKEIEGCNTSFHQMQGIVVRDLLWQS